MSSIMEFAFREAVERNTAPSMVELKLREMDEERESRIKRLGEEAMIRLAAIQERERVKLHTKAKRIARNRRDEAIANILANTYTRNNRCVLKSKHLADYVQEQRSLAAAFASLARPVRYPSPPRHVDPKYPGGTMPSHSTDTEIKRLVLWSDVVQSRGDNDTAERIMRHISFLIVKKNEATMLRGMKHANQNPVVRRVGKRGHTMLCPAPRS